MRVSKDKLAVAAEQNVKERDYWFTQLSGDWMKSTFPYDYSKSEVREYQYRQFKFHFPPELFSKVTALSGGVNVKLHMILVNGLFILLHKYVHDHTDIMIGSPILKQDIEGDFINTVLVFKNRVEDFYSFKELLLQTREIIIKANENQNYPLEILPERLDISSSEDEFPFFDVAILLESLHDKRYLQGIRCNILFSFLETGTSIEGVVEYNWQLYREDTINRIARLYMQILDQGLSQLNLPLHRLQMVPDQERQRILFDFNRTCTSTGDAQEKTLHELFSGQVLKTPDAIALLGNKHDQESGEMLLTYRQLDEMSGQLALLLGEQGVKPGTIVGIMVEPCLEMIIGLMGILKAGAAYLPMDPDYPGKRIRYMLADSSVTTLLTVPAARAKVEVETDSVRIIDISHLTPGSTSHVPVNTASSPTCAANPASLAYVIYTSGSSGDPKGVIVEHTNVIAYLYAFYREFTIDATDTGIQLAPFSFDVFVEEVFPLLLTGGRFIIPETAVMMDMDLLTRLIISHRVTIIDCTPLLLNELNKLTARKGSNRENPLKQSYIHTFISGGDVLKEEYIDKLLKIGKVYNTYGPTESTVCAAYYRCDVSTPSWNVNSSSIPIGQPIANYCLYILDTYLQPVPIGLSGELHISGPGVARGYLNQPALTAEKFIVTPFSWLPLSPTTPKTYKTGDLAQWLEDGNIRFSGRIDQQIKIRGFRVETGEIESHLLKHSEIKEAIVAAREDKYRDKFLCAYIVINREVDLGGLRDSLALELPHYMIPAFFIPLDQIPVTANGKIDRKALPEPKIDAGVEYEAPRNQLQKQMQKIWQEALNLDSVGINDNFFNIGGHSLKGIQVINRLHREFNVKIPLAEMFRTPTIKELSAYIEKAARVQFVSLEPAEKKEYYALSSAQKRLYLQQQLELNSTAYNMMRVTTLKMTIAAGKPEQTFNTLFRRHEIFRTSFEMINREPVQRVHPLQQLEFKINYYEGNEELVNERIEKFLRPFDLSRAPLLRVGIIKTGAQDYVLMTDMHHIISDGLSSGILISDFIRLYSGEELAPLRLQYKDFALWQASETQKEAVKQQGIYWETVFADQIPVLNMPTDHPRPPVQSYAGNMIDFRLEAEKTRTLQQIAREEGVTLYIVLLAIYNIFLAKISRQEDIIVGTSTAGRNHPDLENIIGMFVNTLALRNYPAADKTFTDFLKEVGENSIKAFENGDYPFEEQVEKVVKHRDISRSPIFDVRFSFTSNEQAAPEIPEELPLPAAEKHHTSKFAMTLYAEEAGEKLDFAIEYGTKLFNEETIKRFSAYFREIISIIINNRDIRLMDINISHDFITVQSKAHQIDLDF